MTIKDLKEEDCVYWCAVEIINGLDIGKSFNLSVTGGKISAHLKSFVKLCLFVEKHYRVSHCCIAEFLSVKSYDNTCQI